MKRFIVKTVLSLFIITFSGAVTYATSNNDINSSYFFYNDILLNSINNDNYISNTANVTELISHISDIGLNGYPYDSLSLLLELEKATDFTRTQKDLIDATIKDINKTLLINETSPSNCMEYLRQIEETIICINETGDSKLISSAINKVFEIDQYFSSQLTIPICNKLKKIKGITPQQITRINAIIDESRKKTDQWIFDDINKAYILYQSGNNDDAVQLCKEIKKRDINDEQYRSCNDIIMYTEINKALGLYQDNKYHDAITLCNNIKSNGANEAQSRSCDDIINLANIGIQNNINIALSMYQSENPYEAIQLCEELKKNNLNENQIQSCDDIITLSIDSIIKDIENYCSAKNYSAATNTYEQLYQICPSLQKSTYGPISYRYEKLNSIVIGIACYTDIVAYINNYAIPSYTFDGVSLIIAEDLLKFGFDVTWHESERILTIAHKKHSKIEGVSFRKTHAPGTPFSELRKTDIIVYANGTKIPSYSINGYTLVPLESLAVFGSYNWVDSQRAIKLWINDMKIRTKMQYVPPHNACFHCDGLGYILVTDYDAYEKAYKRYKEEKDSYEKHRKNDINMSMSFSGVSSSLDMLGIMPFPPSYSEYQKRVTCPHCLGTGKK